MPGNPTYPDETRLNIQHGPLEIIDEQAIAEASEHNGFNQTLCQVNDSVVPRGTLHGPRATQRTTMLMIETRGIVPTGS